MADVDDDVVDYLRALNAEDIRKLPKNERPLDKFELRQLEGFTPEQARALASGFGPFELPDEIKRL